MAARRAWIVFVDDPDLIWRDDYHDQRYIPNKEQQNYILSIYFREDYAKSFAEYIANKNPGVEVYLMEQKLGFSAQTKPLEYKEWTKDGLYIPKK